MFTQPCFIRKNTPELREQLGNIGRKLLFSARNGYGSNLFAHKGDLGIIQAYIYFCFGAFDIDCGENEQLFLALAALRDDTDRHQWFTDGTHWERSESELPSRYMQMHGHKATTEEIVEHFKTEQQ